MALRRLKEYACDLAALLRVAALKLQRLQQYGIELPSRREMTHADITPCDKAIALLHGCQPSMLDEYTPDAVSGVANSCLFQSTSVALYGSDEFHTQLC